MRIYIVEYHSVAGPNRHYTSSKAAAEKYMRELRANDDDEIQDGMSNPSLRCEEVPRTKSGLIDWLNIWCNTQ